MQPLESSVPILGWRRPLEVRPVPHGIEYRRERDGDEVQPAPEQLRAFIRLHNSSARDVVGYVARYGALGLCPAHGLPRSHPALFTVGRGGHVELWECGWPDDPAAWVTELMSDWHRLARAARATVLLYGAFANRREGRFDSALWTAVVNGRLLAPPTATSRPDPRTPHGPTGEPQLVVRRRVAVPPAAAVELPRPSEAIPELRRQVNGWLMSAGVGVVIDPGGGTFSLLSTTLFGGLAVQVAVHLVRGSQFAACSVEGCPDIAAPRRRGALALCNDHLGWADMVRAQRFREKHPGYYGAAARQQRKSRQVDG